MKELKDLYNRKIVHNNMTYSIDMIRLKTYLTYDVYNDIDFYIRTYYKDNIKRFYLSDRPMCFHYNYNIEIEEGISFWFGFCHNSEVKMSERFEPQYNFTIEFNPNKLKYNKLLMYLLSKSGKWYILKYDLAIDLRVNIMDLIIDKSGKRKMKCFSNGGDDKTFIIGSADKGLIKIYNKKKESDLKMTGDYTRIEITRLLDDFFIWDTVFFNYIFDFPEVYLSQYVYSLSDYENKDRTTYALLYAVQNGYPINDLSRVYKEKIKKLLKGGYQIKFDTTSANQALKQTIYGYFIENPLVHFKG